MNMPRIPYQRSLLAIAVSSIITVGMTACNDGKTSSQGSTVLVTQTSVEAGEVCANGGVQIGSGVDIDGDGLLSIEETDSSSTICNGGSLTLADVASVTSKLNALVNIVEVAAKDVNCPKGGVKIETGIDIDASESLEVSEVTNTQFVCNGFESLTQVNIEPIGLNCAAGGRRIDTGLDINGDGLLDESEINSSGFLCDSYQFKNPPIDVKPDGPAKQFSITAIGGNGGTGAAGNGGGINLYNSSGADLLISDTGLADASFTIPVVTPEIGEVPLIVSEDLILPVDPDHANYPGTGDYFYVESDVATSISKYDGLDITTVTGLRIDSGVTLTLVQTSGTLLFVNDVVNLGIIASAGTIGLNIDVMNYHGDEASRVNMRGTDSIDAIGADGKSVSITARQAIYNRGDVDTSGGNGITGGGNAGNINFEALQVFQSAQLLANGGNDDDGIDLENGGNGGEISIQTPYFVKILGKLFNRGNLSAVGGFGNIGGGSGKIQMLGNRNTPASIRNEGNLKAASGVGVLSGGKGATPLYSQSSCRYAAISLCSEHGLVNSGDLSTKPGDSSSGAGVTGGGIVIKVSNADRYYGYLAAGDMLVSGNIDSSGGNGVTAGGRAGLINIYGSFDGAPHRQQISFLGFSEINNSGGSSNSGVGGDAAVLALNTESVANDSNYYNYVPSGAVRIYSDLTNNGGFGESGGDGGWVVIDTDRGISAPGVNWQDALVYGKISSNGGNATGVGNGGNAGHSDIFATNDVVLQSIEHRGGSATIGSGGAAGYLSIIAANGDVLLNEDISLVGGDSEGSLGGNGAYVETVGSGNITINGIIDSSGGVSQTSEGGNASYINISGATVADNGSLVANGGAGVKDGADGVINVIAQE